MIESAPPRFSIVIPTYNYAAMLSRAVESAQTQQGADYEIVIIDDGSTDDTPQVLEKLAERSTCPLRFLRQENQGAGAARNHGLDIARGAYLLFLDADDELLPNALAAFRATLSKAPMAKVLIAGHLSKNERGNEKTILPPRLPVSPAQRLQAWLFDKAIPISHGALLLHRDVFERCRYPEHLRSSEDMPVFAHAISNFPCVSVPSSVARIYKHPDSLRHRFDSAETPDLLVNAIFDASRMPNEIMALRETYRTRRLLSLFRLAERAGDSECAWRLWQTAWRQSPWVCRGYLGKALRVWWRLRKQRKGAA